MKEGIGDINKSTSIIVPGASANRPTFIFTNAMMYAVICIVTAAVIGFVFGINIIPGITGIRSAIASAMCFLFLGTFFTTFFYSKFTFPSNSDDTSHTAYVFVVFAGIFAALMLISFVKGNGSVITNLFYSSLFLLPHTIYQAWLFYNRLLFISHRKIWYVPDELSSMQKATVFLNSLTIQIRMAPSYNVPEQMYTTTVPGRLSVGMMFTDFIKNRSNDDGQTKTFDDIDNQLFGWKFFVPAFLGLGQRMVDADVSLDKNKIKNGMVVFAKRIPKQPTALQSIH